MAQTRAGTQGNRENAPMSVPLTTNPDPQHYADLVDFLTPGGRITVQGKAGISIRGWRPGEDIRDPASVLTLPIGGIAQIEIDRPPVVDQDSSLIALLVATGQLDIVPDEEFDKAEPHTLIRDRNRQAELLRQGEREAGGQAGEVALLRHQVDELKAGAPSAEVESLRAELDEARAREEKKDKALAALEKRLAALENPEPGPVGNTGKTKK